MKKILATLLVAAMLMSCMTFVSFAGSSVVSTLSAPAFSTATSGYGSSKNFSDGYTYNYYTYLFTTYIQDDATYNAAKLGQALDSAKSGNTTAFDAYNSNFTFGPGEVIALPVYGDGTGVRTFQANIVIDSDLLEPVLMTGYNNTNLSIDATGKPKIAFANASAISGFATSVYFKVKSDAVGDADGNATTTLTFTNVKAFGAGGDSDVLSTDNLTMTVNLTGLAVGEDDNEELPKVEASDFTSATVAVKGLSAAGFAEDAKGVNVVAGAANSNNYKPTDVYSCIFAEIPVKSGYAEIVDAGICLVGSTGHESYYPAVKSTISSTNKFGMVFFGAEDILSKYTAYVYVQYADGTRVKSSSSYTLID